MYLKKLILSILTIATVLVVSGCNTNDSEDLSIVTTVFPSYDFVNNITKGEADIELLLSPGTDFHSFDPSPKDIIAIESADMFIYIGTETWAETILDGIDTSNMKVIRLMDYVKLEQEMIVEGMEHSHDDEHDHEEEHDHSDEHTHDDEEHIHDDEEHIHDEDCNHDNEDSQTEIDNSYLAINELSAYDEHVWTSINNSILLIKAITKELITIDSEQEDFYNDNSNAYINKLEDLDIDFKELVANSTRNEIVVADKFPFTYFALDYDLDINAAFTGCSTATEAKASTIAYLVNKVENNNIPYVFYIELSNQIVANSIVEETEAEKLELHSAHNLTLDDFNSGKTYYDYMLNNYNNLKKALN